MPIFLPNQPDSCEALKKNMELLSPAGSLQKLKYALHYGADAVYCAGKSFLAWKRAIYPIKKFFASWFELLAIFLPKTRSSYITLNIFAQTKFFISLSELSEFLHLYLVLFSKKEVKRNRKPSRGLLVIVSDPEGFCPLSSDHPRGWQKIKSRCFDRDPQLKPTKCAKFWHQLYLLGEGATRVVLARELSLPNTLPSYISR